MQPASNPKKILVFCGGVYVFGAEIITLDLMRALRARGHDVRCVVSGWNDGDFIRRLNAASIPHYSVKLGYLFLTKPLWTLDGLVHYPGSIARLAKIASDFSPDFVYHQGLRSLLVSFFLWDRRRTLVHVMETEAHSARSVPRYRVASALSARFIAISEFIKRDLVEKGIASDRINVVYPSIDLPVRPAKGAQAEASAPLRIGIVGQVIPRKGHADLLDALARLDAGGLAFRLHVYGRGDDAWTARLHDQAQRAGLADRVEWHGFVADRSAIYEDLDVVVVPTRDEEAFGMVAAEPAALGVPVIASRSGGLPEIVVDGETGLLFRPGDVADLARQLERLAKDVALRARLAENARRRVQAKFSTEVTVRTLESVLGDLEAAAPGNSL